MYSLSFPVIDNTKVQRPSSRAKDKKTSLLNKIIKTQRVENTIFWRYMVIKALKSDKWRCTDGGAKPLLLNKKNFCPLFFLKILLFRHFPQLKKAAVGSLSVLQRRRGTLVFLDQKPTVLLLTGQHPVAWHRCRTFVRHLFNAAFEALTLARGGTTLPSRWR